MCCVFVQLVGSLSCYANIDHIKHISFPQLQDLAVSPGARDPRLNTVECVIEGHETDIMATGQTSSYIRAILWCAFIFSFWAGPYLAEIILGVIKQRSQSPKSAMELHDLQAPTSLGPRENISEPLIRAVVCVCCLLLCVEIIILGFIVKFSVSGNAPIDVYIYIGILILEGVILTCIKKCPSKRDVFISTFCLIFTSHHFCWLVIGIMINPVWRLTVLLLACFSVILLTFLLSQIFEGGNFDIMQIIVCGVTFCGGFSLVASAVLAGQSFYGRGTADELVKTVLLSVISVGTSLLSWRSKNNETIEENAPSVPPDYEQAPLEES